MSSNSNFNQNIFITIFSIGLILFLSWFIYLKEAAGMGEYVWAQKLPAVNAFLNALTTIFLINGFVAIKKGNKSLHIKYMVTAMFSSLLFLISYLLYHHFHGDTKFLAQGFIRPVYFFILISHIGLSGILVPLVLGTVINAAKGNFEVHKKWAKWAFPIWIYVSVTGVLIYFFIIIFNNAL